MPTYTLTLKNPPSWVTEWSAAFVRRNPDGSNSIIGVPDRLPASYNVSEDITFSSIAEPLGFFDIEVVGIVNGMQRQINRAFPATGQNMTLPNTDAAFEIDGGGFNMMWLLLGALALGVAFFGARRR